MIVDLCQRWRERRGVYRPAREPFDPRRYEVAEFYDDATADAFVGAHHYIGTLPPVQRRFGLYEGGELVGVVIFSVPTNYGSLRPWGKDDATELGRLVLLDHVLANAESWFVRRCLDELARDGLAGVVSHSDPEPRRDAAGNLVFKGHVGTVYQALNAVYTGRASRKTMYLLADGREFNNRAASKIRAYAKGGATKRSRGWRYAIAQLVAEGARQPEPGEDLTVWLRSERKRLTRSQAHPGNHRYVFALSRGAHKDMRRQSLPYPKFETHGVHLPLFAGGAA